MEDKTMEIQDYVDLLGVGMKEAGYKNMKISFRLIEGDDRIPIEHLDLKARSEHALRRSKINTLADLINQIDGTYDLMKIQSLGKGSAKEIMNVLLRFHIQRNLDAKRGPYDGIVLC